MKKLTLLLMAGLFLSPVTFALITGCSGKNTPTAAASGYTPVPTAPVTGTVTPTVTMSATMTVTPTVTATVTMTVTATVTPTATPRYFYVEGTSPLYPSYMDWTLTASYTAGVTTLLGSASPSLPYNSMTASGPLTFQAKPGNYTLTVSFDVVSNAGPTDVLSYGAYYTDNTLIINGAVTGTQTEVTTFTLY